MDNAAYAGFAKFYKQPVSVTVTVNRSTDRAVLGVVPTSPAEVGSVVDL